MNLCDFQNSICSAHYSLKKYNKIFLDLKGFYSCFLLSFFFFSFFQDFRARDVGTYK